MQRRENDAHGEDSGMTLKMDGKVEAKVIFFLSMAMTWILVWKDY